MPLARTAVDVRDHLSRERVADNLGDVARRLAPLYERAPHPYPGGTSAGAALDLALLERELSSFALASLVPPSLRRAVPRRQVAWIGGRLCAERALEQLGMDDVGVPRGTQGEPVWPSGVAGSITHTNTTACALVVRRVDGAGLGIDSELLVGDDARDAVAAVCCRLHERNAWLRGPDARLRTTLLFAAKEALYKAVWPAVRRFIDFDEATVAGWDVASRTLTLRLEPSLTPGLVLAPYVVDDARGAVHVRVTLDEALVARLA